MDAGHVFIFRAVVAVIAGGFGLFVVFLLLGSVLRTGRRALKEILRVSALMLSMFLAVIFSRGEISPMGAWAGFGGAALATALAFLI